MEAGEGGRVERVGEGEGKRRIREEGQGYGVVKHGRSCICRCSRHPTCRLDRLSTQGDK